MINKNNPKINRGAKFIQQLIRFQEKNQEFKLNTSADFTPSSRSQSNLQSEDKGRENDQKIVCRKKERNFFNKVYTLHPGLQNKHIFKLFGYKGINQTAFQNPNFEQSLFSSHFQSRIVEKVQIYEHAIVIEMTEPNIPLNQPSVEYIIEKYKSKGDAKFYELAILIEELNQLLKLSQFTSKSQEKAEPIKKWLDYLGDSMYVCTLGSRKVAVSKSLLTYLEYDVNEFAIEAIKYRAIFQEFFSALNYADALLQLLKCLKYITQFSIQKLSLEEFRELTTYHFNDFMISKSKVKSFCSMSFFMLNPTYLCHKVNYVYYQTDEFNFPLRKKNPQMLKGIEQVKQKMQYAQFQILNKVSKCPKNYMEQNQKQVATYKEIEQK